MSNLIEDYKTNLDNAFNYLEDVANKNGFYGPTRQKVCSIIWKDKNNSLENLEKAVKYLQRRFQEQELEELFKEESCQKVFDNELWNKRWPENIIVLADGEEIINPVKILK